MFERYWRRLVTGAVVAAVQFDTKRMSRLALERTAFVSRLVLFSGPGLTVWDGSSPNDNPLGAPS